MKNRARSKRLLQRGTFTARKARWLLCETLESRELMASDLGNFWPSNYAGHVSEIVAANPSLPSWWAGCPLFENNIPAIAMHCPLPNAVLPELVHTTTAAITNEQANPSNPEKVAATPFCPVVPTDTPTVNNPAAATEETAAYPLNIPPDLPSNHPTNDPATDPTIDEGAIPQVIDYDPTQVRTYVREGHTIEFTFGDDPRYASLPVRHDLVVRVDGGESIPIPHYYEGYSAISNLSYQDGRFQFAVSRRADVWHMTADFIYMSPEAELKYIHETGEIDTEIYSTDGTVAGTHHIKSLVYRPSEHVTVLDLITLKTFSLGDREVRLINPNKYAFYSPPKELWAIDQNDPSKHEVLATGCDSFAELNNSKTRIVFSKEGELWGSDGTAAGTQPLVQLEAIQTNSLFAGGPVTLVPSIKAIDHVGDHTYFQVQYLENYAGTSLQSNGNIWELWTTDGTVAGTKKLSELIHAEYGVSASPAHFDIIDGTTVLSIADPEYALEYHVYKTDGTPAGTQFQGTLEFDYSASDWPNSRLQQLRSLLEHPQHPLVSQQYTGALACVLRIANPLS